MSSICLVVLLIALVCAMFLFLKACRRSEGAAVVFPSHCWMGNCNVIMPRTTSNANGLEVRPAERQLCVAGRVVLATLAHSWEGTLPGSHHTTLSGLLTKLISDYIMPPCAMPSVGA